MAKINLKTILTFAVQKNASDIHLQVGEPPVLRLQGELIHIKHPPLTDEDMLSIGLYLTGIKEPDTFRKEVREYDGSFQLDDVSRFRVNVFRQNGKYAAVLRVIPLEVRSFTELNLPPVLNQISDLRCGLILVTGATGMGKSTTLAAMINHINHTRHCHIVTIEDPIEFLFKNKNSIISQREVGSDTDSFNMALRAALRQDPDIIMVGELRDLQTVDTCLKAAETGHLVMGSIHTPDVLRTFGRLIGFFPTEEQQNLRQRLSENLMVIISMKLLVNKEGTLLVPACEVLIVNKTIEICIKNPEKTVEIPKYMEKNKDLGMQTFDQHLVEMVESNKISLAEAKSASFHPDQLERNLTIVGH
ncbi:MAG: PilT/PilU family type 4a pilus ATPase [Candidatus Aminicenantes bacterium]|nr:PilT/PilU family type 4a pilus ATPase [Candidatus Aminicenantes bacterium]